MKQLEKQKLVDKLNADTAYREWFVSESGPLATFLKTNLMEKRAMDATVLERKIERVTSDFTKMQRPKGYFLLKADAEAHLGRMMYPEEISTSPLGEGLFLKRTVGMEIPENAFELLEGHVDKMDDRTVVGSTNAARTNIMPGQLDAIARGVRGSRISCRHHELESCPIVSPIPSFPQVMRTR